MGAPRNNQHAAKTEEARASSFLHIRCRPDQKARWVRAANDAARRSGQADARGVLAGWVTDKLDQAAG